MTKDEAIQAMKEGKKVTHRNFTEDEFITMGNGIIIDENDYHLDPNEFWSYRTNTNWDNDWKLFDESPSGKEDVQEAAKEYANNFLTDYDDEKVVARTPLDIRGYCETSFLAGASWQSSRSENQDEQIKMWQEIWAEIMNGNLKTITIALLKQKFTLTKK